MNLRSLGRSFVLALFWDVFVVSWATVLRQARAFEVLKSVLLLAIIVVAYGAVLGLWIRHRKRVYATKPARTRIPLVQRSSCVDVLGRTVLLDDDADWGDRHLIVDSAEHRKTFRKGSVVLSGRVLSREVRFASESD